MTKFLSLKRTILIHQELIAHFGGARELRDGNLLASALSRPKSSFDSQDLYPGVFEKAGALFQSLLLNHAFEDGNKRTAVTSTAAFLYLNGWELNLPFKESLNFVLEAEAKKLSLVQISRWLKSHSDRV